MYTLPQMTKMLLIKRIVVETCYLFLIKKILLGKKITELRKVGFEKVTIKTLQLIKTKVNDRLTN